MMNDTTVDVNQLADQLAKIAGPIAKQGWEIYVRQQYVAGAQELLAAAVALAVGISLVLFGNHLRRQAKDADWSSRGELDFGGFLCYLLAAIAAVVLVLWIGDAVAHFVNPQFYAIQGILGR